MVVSATFTPVARLPSLSPSSYVVLGLLRQRGPSTPYDLKQAIASSIGYFWDFPHSQLYVEPGRLADAGLLVEEREADGRRRRIFSVTDRGVEALEAWLGDANASPAEIRDPGLLKLFFSGSARPSEVKALADVQVREHRKRLEDYEALDTRLADQAGLDHQRRTLRMGLLFERAAMAFWEEVLTDPPEAPPRRRPARR